MSGRDRVPLAAMLGAGLLLAWSFVFAAGAVALCARMLIRHPVERRHAA